MTEYSITIKLWAPDYMTLEDVEESVMTKMTAQGSYLVTSSVEAREEDAIEKDCDKVITLVKTLETCAACPSQWDAWDDSGTQYYLRYRHSYGSIEIRDDHKDNGLIINYFTTDELDGGVISLRDFISHCPRFRLADDVQED